MLFRFLILFLCLTLSTTVDAAHRNNRYRDQTEEPQTVTVAPPTTHGNVHRTSPFVDDDFDDDADYEDEETTQIHGPLGAICSDLANYCSYFARNMMTDEQQAKNRNSLLLFCNVMELMADLSDYESTPVRAETYTTDIINVVASLRDAFQSDEDLHGNAEKFPLLERLFLLRERSFGEEENDLEVELDIYFHNMLRSKESAQPLINAIFGELNAYTQEKTHALLDIFHNDSLKLIDLSTHAIEPQRSPYRTPHGSSEKRHLREMSWLCHHASDACLDLAEAFPHSPVMSQAAPLMKQIQSMLSAMSLTYEQLGSEAGAVRSHSRSELAGHFAEMIDLMPETAPRRTTRHSPGTAYIDRCSQLKGVERKRHFVEEAFSSELDRQALLAEFFPLFEKAMNYNLDTFTGSLSTYTNETLHQCYWPEGLLQ